MQFAPTLLLPTFSGDFVHLFENLLPQPVAEECRVMELGRTLIDDATRTERTRRVLEEVTVTALIATRKPRSCDRGLRQPAKKGKKIRQPTSIPLVKKIIFGLMNP